MAEFRDISLFDIVTNISLSEAQERYIQISASNRISLYEIAKLCQYVSLSDISPSMDDLPSSPSLSDYLSYLLGHLSSSGHEFRYTTGQITVNGGETVISPGVSSVIINLANFSVSSGWRSFQNNSVIFIPSVTSSSLNKSRFSFTNGPSGYDYKLHFDANWNNNLPSSGSARIEIELTGINSNTNEVYFFVHMIPGESQE